MEKRFGVRFFAVCRSVDGANQWLMMFQVDRQWEFISRWKNKSRNKVKTYPS